MHFWYVGSVEAQLAAFDHDRGMSGRRQFLGVLAGAALSSAVRRARAAKPEPARRSRIRAVAFDLFTIFDPRSVVAVAESVVPDHARELCESWRVRQFEYTWLHTSAGTYRDFHAITEDALAYAARAQGLSLSADVRRTLVGSYERLAPWPDSQAALESMKTAGLRLAPLANFTPAMIEHLLGHAGLRPLFDEIISTDRAKTFKPDPRAYALGPSVLKLHREDIAFAAFGGWDAAGAKWFGYPSFWVNRLGVPAEELPPGPDAVGSTVTEVASWVAAR
jgi:2-haloacid dehalogenase